MTKKNIIIIFSVAVILVVLAVAAVTMLGNDSEVVTYNGNGGITEDGETVFTCSNTTAIENVFMNNGCAFVGWNTESDGSGTAYSVGEDVSYGTTLYAQWSYVVNDYNITRYNCEYFSFHIDGETLGIDSLVSSGSIITVSGGSGWTLGDNNAFTCTIGGLDYSAVVVISGTSDPVYAINDDVPTITLGVVSQNISVNITCSRIL